MHLSLVKTVLILGTGPIEFLQDVNQVLGMAYMKVACSEPCRVIANHAEDSRIRPFSLLSPHREVEEHVD